jgi:molybdenum cofactor cytidylyltransferase
MAQLQALILAAGSSRRFPANKLLRPLPDNRCLLDIAYQLASRLTPNILLVINSDEQMQQHCRAHRYNTLINSQADTGMASSIACAVAATPDADGWAIFLADMPCIKPSTLKLLAEGWRAHDVTVPDYQQLHGHPVIFSRNWFSALSTLSGDQGARGLLQDNPAVYHLQTNDAGVCVDIDTEADWTVYIKNGCQ